MHEQEIELSVGDSLLVGDHFITIVDIEDDVVSFRIDHESEQQYLSVGSFDEIDEALRR